MNWTKYLKVIATAVGGSAIAAVSGIGLENAPWAAHLSEPIRIALSVLLPIVGAHFMPSPNAPATLGERIGAVVKK